MKLTFRNKYKDLSDKEIVDRILAAPSDEEAAVYLIYDRYEPLCITLCQKVLGNARELDQLQSELFMLLKGKRHDWHALRSFQWRSSLGTWLRITAFNLSLELRRSLIENEGRNTSIDTGWTGDEEKPRPIEIPVNEEQEQERRYDMVVLNEAIGKLANPDQGFVVRRRLEGYSSKEVADLLGRHWESQGIVRLNVKGQAVIPDSGYIDNLFKRGYDKAKEIYKTLNR